MNNKEEILKKIKEIENILKNKIIDENDTRYGLLAGFSGVSFFFYFNFLMTNEDENLKCIEKIIARGLNALNNIELNPFFCNGISGFSFLINFFNKKGLLEIDVSLKQDLNKIDNYLNHYYELSLKLKNFDFLHGSEGLLIYFLTQKNSNKYIDLYISCLSENKKMITNKAIAWKSNVSYENGNKLVYNLGLAHGMASTLIILSSIYKLENSINKKLIKSLLIGLVDFFLSEKITTNQYSYFPNYSSFDEKPINSRLAWCYGDLGICVAFWQAGEALQDENIKQEAIAICLHTTKRKNQQSTSVMDAGVCHGTAGIAHIYNRMFRYTGMIEFKEAANYWINETLKIARYDDGLAGYKMWNKNGCKNEINLLDGITGIGLVLLSHISDEEPIWDRCLLLS